MKPWKLVLEVGMDPGRQEEPPATLKAPEAPAINQEGAWKLLVEARKNLIAAMTKMDVETIESINHWIGGAIAMLGAITGESPSSIQDRLSQQIPSPAPPPIPAGMQFAEVERSRPKPHPGAPRPVDMSTLTPEELERLGVTLAEEPSSSG